jgi:protein gp37
MSDKSKIEWCDATWGVVTGCTPVSDGCKHCYAKRDWARLSANPKTVYFGRQFSDVKCHPEKLDLPLHWKRPRRIFVNSMGDLFHPDVPDSFIHAVWNTMAQARQHTFLILTKRPERMSLQPWIYSGLTLRERMDGSPLRNVWLDVTAENQAAADERISLLLQTPAAKRFVSIEPMLGPIALHLMEYGDAADRQFPGGTCLTTRRRAIDLVIVGGESGPKRREMDHAWARSIRDQCFEAGVPFFMKQLEVGGKVEKDIELFPDDLRIQEYPK